MFTGLSAFPLTPMNEKDINEAAFIRLVERLSAAGASAVLPNVASIKIPGVPLPLKTLEGEDRQALGAVLEELGLS